MSEDLKLCARYVMLSKRTHYFHNLHLKLLINFFFHFAINIQPMIYSLHVHTCTVGSQLSEHVGTRGVWITEMYG